MQVHRWGPFPLCTQVLSCMPHCLSFLFLFAFVMINSKDRHTRDTVSIAYGSTPRIYNIYNIHTLRKRIFTVPRYSIKGFWSTKKSNRSFCMGILDFLFISQAAQAQFIISLFSIESAALFSLVFKVQSSRTKKA